MLHYPPLQEDCPQSLSVGCSHCSMLVDVLIFQGSMLGVADKLPALNTIGRDLQLIDGDGNDVQ